MAYSTEKLLFIYNSPILLRPPGKNLCKQPLTPSEIASFWSPTTLRISLALRGEGGIWIFSGTTHFLYSLCKEIKQQVEEQTTIFVQITYESQEDVSRHMSVVQKYTADICTSEYLAVANF